MREHDAEEKVARQASVGRFTFVLSRHRTRPLGGGARGCPMTTPALVQTKASISHQLEHYISYTPDAARSPLTP